MAKDLRKDGTTGVAGVGFMGLQFSTGRHPRPLCHGLALHAPVLPTFGKLIQLHCTGLDSRHF
jgi:hypothetical protein